MVNFNIKDYLVEENFERPNFEGVFYGELEDKPETERALFRMQLDYFNNNRDRDIWRQMFALCWDYMRSLILQRIKGKNFVEPEIIDEQTTSATLAFMSQYLTRPEFEVGASFAGMMKWKIIEVLYKGKNPKSNGGEPISLQYEIDNDGKSTLEDLIPANDVVYSPEENALKRAPYDIIEEILHELDETLECKNAFYIKTIVRLYILLCLRHPKNRHAKKMFLDKWSKEYKIERLINYVMLELRNRLLEE